MTASLPWLRLYDEVLDDPKVQRLTDAQFRAWVNLLCLANRGTPRGRLPENIEDIAYSLRLTSRKTREVLDVFLSRGLLVREENTSSVMPNNWDERQRKSDGSAERVAKHRAKQADGNVTYPLQETGASRSREEIEKKQRREEITETTSPSSPEQAGASAPETEQIDPLFLQFWAMYPTGRGKRIPALREWNKLKADEKRAALERLPLFVACHDWQKEGGRFVRHAERWIKDRGWKDDVPPEPIRVVPGPQSRPKQGGFFAAGQSIDEEKSYERQGNRHGAGDDYRALLADPEDGGAQRGTHGSDLAEGPGGYSVAATYRTRS